MMLAFFRLLAGSAALAYGSYTDLKTRKVPDGVWVLGGALGTFLLAAENGLARWLGLLAPALVLFAYAFVEPGKRTCLRERTVRRELWYALCAAAGVCYLVHLLQAPLEVSVKLSLVSVVILIAYGLYYAGLLFGGADAKALMMLALLVPAQPRTGILQPYPLLAQYWPFSITIFTNALLVSLCLPLAMLLYNCARRDLRLPEALLGYRVDVEKAREKFVWLMEDVVDCKKRRVLFPKERSEEKKKRALEQLRALGVRKVWATPKIPFIVPLFAGYLCAWFLGDLLLGVIGMCR
jgi:preflagellin peptidase FlaK